VSDAETVHDFILWFDEIHASAGAAPGEDTGA
jgi:hypothetical protein